MPTATMITLDSGVTVPLITPNVVMDGDDFYISYNGVDAAIYGGQTTALVIGQMQAFYILNGDHQAAYAALIPQGLSACLAYFKAHQGQKNKFSDLIGDA
jgi:sulfur transfer complex TusBCD TusB component (DsrH family)